MSRDGMGEWRPVLCRSRIGPPEADPSRSIDLCAETHDRAYDHESGPSSTDVRRYSYGGSWVVGDRRPGPSCG